MPKLAFKVLGKVLAFGVFIFVFLCAGSSIFLVSAGWVDPYQLFPNLPEPPAVEVGSGGEEGGGLPDIPGLDPERVPQFELPPIPENLQPGESVPLREKVERRPLTSMIPAPQQVSTAPSVIGTNLFLAILMALVFGVCVTVLDNMINDEQVRIQAWLRAYGIDRIVPKVQNVLGWSASRAVRQGLLTLPIVILILALYGIIFAFLERGTSIFSREGAFLAVTMAFSVGLVSFAGDVVRRIFARIWGADSSFNLYPISLLIAVLTVGVSRLFAITPGIVFGVPGGADVDMPAAKRQQREITLAAATLITLIVLAGAGWLLSGVVLRVINTPIEERVAETIAGLVGGVQNVSLLLFLVALETIFFESLPVAYSNGRTLFKWNKLVWGVLFIPVAFVFNHVLLNPQSEFLSSFDLANVKMLWFILFGLMGLTAALWFYFNVVDDVLQEWVGLKRPS